MTRAPIDRRRFLEGSILGAVLLPAVALPGGADAQRRRAATGPTRAEWSATGAPEGRAPVDASSLTGEERMHVPVLTLPERVRAGRAFDLVVQVGVRPHELTDEHRIDWIEVCLDERRVWVADLSLDVAYPIVRVPIVVREPAMLTARARCSQHGVWMTRRPIAFP